MSTPKTIVINIKTNRSTHFYIGRGSFCENPFYIGKDGTREEVIKKYKIWFKLQLQDSKFKRKILELKGKILGCYCKPKLCHGDIIANYLDNGIC